MTRFSRILLVALTGTFAFPAIAQLEPVAIAAEPEATNMTPTQATAVEVTPENSAFDAAPLTATALQAHAGREDTAMLAQSNSNAAVTNNRLGDNSVTGDIGVDDQAFQNLSGLSLLNINTGNNVAINASMNVNISITQGQ